MSNPLPIRLLDNHLMRSKRPVLVAGVLLFAPLFLLYLLSGAYYPADIPPWDRDPLEITGLFILASVLPAYILMCYLVALRANRCITAELSRLTDQGEALLAQRYQKAGGWPLFMVLGWLFALRWNVGWESLSFNPDDAAFLISVEIVFAQLVLWTVISLFLYFSVLDGLLMHRLGSMVRVDLYHLDSLNGFGRVSLNAFLMIVGAMALTTLQSINQEFQWTYYRNTIVVGVPAVLLLVTLPIWSIHRRIRAEKKRHVAEIDAEIAKTSRYLLSGDLERMNGLLQRRELIQHLRNWPMDLSIFSRFVLYVFIPPLAWIGAALVEFMLDSFLAG